MTGVILMAHFAFSLTRLIKTYQWILQFKPYITSIVRKQYLYISCFPTNVDFTTIKGIVLNLNWMYQIDCRHYRMHSQLIDSWQKNWKLCEIYFWMKKFIYVWIYLFAIHVLYLCTGEALSSSNYIDHGEGTMDSETLSVYCTVWRIVIHMYESV